MWDSWSAKSGIELGAGLGLPSIVASNLGAKMTATDGDDTLLHLLGMNTERNALVQKLLLGTAEPLGALGLEEPDFVLEQSGSVGCASGDNQVVVREQYCGGDCKRLQDPL